MVDGKGEGRKEGSLGIHRRKGVGFRSMSVVWKGKEVWFGKISGSQL